MNPRQSEDQPSVSDTGIIKLGDACFVAMPLMLGYATYQNYSELESLVRKHTFDTDYALPAMMLFVGSTSGAMAFFLYRLFFCNSNNNTNTAEVKADKQPGFLSSTAGTLFNGFGNCFKRVKALADQAAEKMSFVPAQKGPGK